MARNTRAKKTEAPKVDIGAEIFESLAELEKLNRMPEPTKSQPAVQPVVEDDVKVAAPKAPKAPKAEPVQRPATAGTRVFGSDFKEAVKKGIEGEQYTFDDLDLSILDK